MYFNQDNVRIHYDYIHSTSEDTLDTLVFVHGVGLDLHSWDYMIPYLNNNYHILRYDIRGHGESESGNKKIDIDTLAADIKGLINHLRIGNFHLIAQGFGGMIAVYLANQGIKNFKSLILLSVPFIYPQSIGNLEIQKRQELVTDHRNMSQLGNHIIKNIVLDIDDRKKEILLGAYEKVNPKVYFELFHMNHIPSSANQLRKVTHPILFLSGSEDEIYPPEITIASLNLNPRARYLIIPDASFLIQIDQPQITATWIKQFISKVNLNSYRLDHINLSYKQDLTKLLIIELQELMNKELKKDGNLKEGFPTITVCVLNGFRVFVNGNQVIEGWGKRKAKQILIFLVLQKSVTRDDICDVFWPDIDIKDARNRLRVSLHHLKQLFGENQSSFLVTERENIYLKGVITCDLLEMIEDMKSFQEIHDIHRKAELFTIFLSKIPENPLPGLYEEWFINLRNRIERGWGDMALYLKEYFTQNQDYRMALFYLEKAMKYHHEDDHLLIDFNSFKDSYY